MEATEGTYITKNEAPLFLSLFPLLPPVKILCHVFVSWMDWRERWLFVARDCDSCKKNAKTLKTSSLIFFATSARLGFATFVLKLFVVFFGCGGSRWEFAYKRQVRAPRLHTLKKLMEPACPQAGQFHINSAFGNLFIPSFPHTPAGFRWRSARTCTPHRAWP